MNYDKLFDDTFSYHFQSKDVPLLKEYLQKKQGWIYIAHSKNNSLLKIGRTGKNPLERAKTLSSTGVLHDYEILFSLRVFNQFLVESKVHQRLNKFRISKEFFSVKESVAIDAIQIECHKEKLLLDRFFDTQAVIEDINLLDYSLKN